MNQRLIHAQVRLRLIVIINILDFDKEGIIHDKMLLEEINIIFDLFQHVLFLKLVHLQHILFHLPLYLQEVYVFQGFLLH